MGGVKQRDWDGLPVARGLVFDGHPADMGHPWVKRRSVFTGSL